MTPWHHNGKNWDDDIYDSQLELSPNNMSFELRYVFYYISFFILMHIYIIG